MIKPAIIKKVQPYEKCRRVGRFRLPAHLVESRHPLVTRIMGMCAILSAQYVYDYDGYEYMATCRLFREVPVGQVSPHYTWFGNDDGEIWVR